MRKKVLGLSMTLIVALATLVLGISGLFLPTSARAAETQHVTNETELVTALNKGQEAVLSNNVTLTGEINLTKAVIDLNGKTLKLGAGQNSIEGTTTIKNGTIDVSGVVATGDAIIEIGKSATATLNLNGVTVYGNTYSSAYAVLYVYGSSTLNITGGAIDVSNDTSGDGGVIKAEDATNGKINITGTATDPVELSFNNAKIGFLHGTVVLDYVDLDIKNSANAINGSALTVKNSTVDITNANGRAITLEKGDVVIENSTLNLSNCSEGEIRFKTSTNLSVDPTSSISECTIWADETATNATVNGNVVFTGSSGSEDHPSTVTISGGTTTVTPYIYPIYIGEAGYDTIAQAIEAVETANVAGTYTIALSAGTYAEDLIINQMEGINVVIKGTGAETIFTGTIKVYGHARYTGAETLTIDGIAFQTTEAEHTFVFQVQQTGDATWSHVKCYPHNVTIQNCTFKATGAAENTAVGAKFRYGYNNAIKNVTSIGMHSLIQNYAGVNLNISDVNVTGKNGIALGSCKSATITNATINATGYGVRADANVGEANVTIESSDITAMIPVVVRNASVEGYNLTFTGTNDMTATNSEGIWLAVGTKEYEGDSTAVTAPTAKVYVTINDAGLSEDGILQEVIGDGSITNPYRIYDLSDLLKFAADVNAGNSYKNKYVKLYNNIDLASIANWTPIGNSTNKFEGHFDGGNFTISNLKINNMSSYMGLFGFTANGSLKNLTLHNVDIDARLGAGALAGSPYTSDVDNVKLTGLVTIDAMFYVGGVVGRNAYGDLTNITVDVEAGSYVKANSIEYDPSSEYADANGNVSYRTYVGGVVGFMGEGGSIVENVTSNINVIGSTIDVGGITGIAHYGNKFNNVTNTGNVTLTNGESFEDALQVGGIAGVWMNTSSDVTFTNCVSTGSISSTYVDENGATVTLTNADLPNGGLFGDSYYADDNGTSDIVSDLAAYTVINGTVNYYTSFADALVAVANEKNAVIGLITDVTYDVAAWDNNAIGTAVNKTITINGNGRTLTFNNTNSDWNNVVTNGATLILNDMTIANSGYNNGPWNRRDINFGCYVELNDVTSVRSIALKAGGKLNNVTIDDTSDNYALWIVANGQNVAIDGLTVTAGRGIKIDEQYQDAPANVALTVENAKFTTTKKAAILVKSEAGANIALSNVDISGVVADPVNAVMIDEDAPETYNVTTVTGGTVALESPAKVVATIGGKYYASVNNAINASQAGDVIVIYQDLEISDTIIVNKDQTIVIDLNGKTITGVPAEAGYAVINNKGNLTIGGGGVIVCQNAVAVNNAKAVNTIVNGGTLTINDATIKNVAVNGQTQIGYAIDNNSGNGNAIVKINAGAEVVAEGSAYYDAIRLFANSTTNENNVIVLGGTVGSIWMQNPSDGSNGNNAKDVKANVEISGGTVSALYLEPSATFTAAVTGGNIGKIDYFNEEGSSRDLTGFVTGGTFNTAIGSAFLKKGFVLEANADGTYGAVELPINAEISYNAYASIQSDRHSIKFDMFDVYAKESLVVIMYNANGDKLATTTLRQTDRDDANVKLYPFVGDITANIVVWGRIAGSWDTVWHKEGTYPNATCVLSVGDMPSYFEVYVDGTLMAKSSGDAFSSDAWELAFQSFNNVFKAAEIVDVNGDTKAFYADITSAAKAIAAGETLKLYAGTYNETLSINKANVTVIGEVDANGDNLVNINGKLSISANGVTVKNINVSNPGTSAGYIGGKDVVIDNCTVKGGNGFRSCYTSGTVTFKNSTIIGDTYGIHFDGNKDGNIVIENCTVSGWTSFAASLNKVTMTGTDFAQGGYNYIRFYQDAVVEDCKFNDEMQIDVSNGMDVDVDVKNSVIYDSTGTTVGNAKDLFDEYDIATNDVVVDGVRLVREAQIGDVFYEKFADAFAALKDGDTLTIHEPISLTNVLDISAFSNLTINGTGHTLTTSAKRGINYAPTISTVATGSEITIKNLTIDAISYCERGINYAYGGTLNVDNVTVKGATYAINLPGSSNNAIVNVTNSTLHGLNTVNVWGANAEVNITDTAVICDGLDTAVEGYAAIILNNNGTTSAEGTVVNVTGGSITANAFHNATSNATKTGQIVISGTTTVTGATVDLVAIASDGYSFETLQSAIDYAEAKGVTLKLLKDIALDKTIVVDGTVTLDLNGCTISGTDNNTSGNFYLISVNKGNLTVNDSVGTGAITLNAINDRDWNASSVVIANNQGTVTVNGGTIQHNGGTDMAYALDNLTNGGIGDAVMTINGGNIKSTYRAIRQFANSSTKNNVLTITGGNVEYVWMQSPNSKLNTVSTAIVGGNVAELKISGENAVYDLQANASAVGAIVGTMPNGMSLVNNNGVYGLVEGVASIGSVSYVTVADAVAAANDGDTIILIKDVADMGSVTINKAITIDGNGKTISGDSRFVITTSGVTVENANFANIANGTNQLSAIIVNGLAGTVTINNNTFSNVQWDAIQIASSKNGAKAIITNNVFNAPTAGVNQKRHLHIEAVKAEAPVMDITVTGNKFYGSDIASIGIWHASVASTIKADKNYVQDPTTISITGIKDGAVVNITEKALPLYDEALASEIAFVARVQKNTYNSVFYTNLADALAAAEEGETVVIMADGEYEFGNGPANNNVTIAGGKDVKASFNLRDKTPNLGGKNVTFNDLTLTYSNANYTGLQHSGDLTYNNVTINGQPFLYGTKEIFNNCTFIQTSSNAYNVWTYGADYVEFNNCTFYSAGKSVLVYNEGGAGATELKVNDTKFIASEQVDGKAAIEIDSSLLQGDETMDIEINNSTATGFANGNDSGNSLWNNKKGAQTSPDVSIEVDGVLVYDYYREAAIGSTRYEKLQQAIDAAQDGDEITLLLDVTDNVTINQKADVDVVLNGNGKTFTGTINVYGNSRFTGEETLTIKNFNFVTDKATHNFIWSDNGSDGTMRYAHNVTVENCDFTATAQNNAVVAVRFRQAYDVAIVNSTATGLHSVTQLVNNTGVVVDGLIANGCEEGALAIGASTGVVVKNSNLSGSKYGIRVDANTEKACAMVLENNIITADQPVVVRYATESYDLSVGANNVFNGTTAEGYQIVVTNDNFGTYVTPTGSVVVSGATNLLTYGLVACIDKIAYTSLQEAVDAVKDGQTITLLEDYVVTNDNYYDAGNGWKEGIKSTTSNSYVLDLNGHSIIDNGVVNDYVLYFTNLGTTDNEITVKNGKIQTASNAFAAITVSGAASTAKTTLNLENVKIITDGINVPGGELAVKVRNGSTVNVKSGTTITTTNTDYVIAPDATATVNIYDGAVITAGAGTATAISGNGIVNVYGGTINANGAGSTAVYTYTSGKPVINISGGTFNGDVVAAADTGSYPTAKPYINITDGEFNGNIYASYYGPAPANEKTIEVSGGSFKYDFSEDYFADKKATYYNATTGRYEMIDVIIRVEYADSTYAYFQNILDAVPFTSNYPKLEGATIKLLGNYTGSGMRFMENGMVLDLNGFTYTVNAGVGSSGTRTQAFQIRPEVTGTATIKNGTVAIADPSAMQTPYDQIAWVFNSYAANFVIENVTVDMTNMTWAYGANTYGIVVQSAEDKVVLADNTKFTNFDASVGGNIIYVGGALDVADTAVVGGTIEFADGAKVTGPAGLGVIGEQPDILVVYDATTRTYTTAIAEAKIGEVRYLTFLDAIANVQDGETITLVKDIVLADQLKLTNKEFTIDGAEKTISGNGRIWLLSGDYAIKNVVFANMNSTGFGVVEFTYANATVENCTFVGNNAASMIAVDTNANGAGTSNVTITGCEFTNNVCGTSVINVSEGNATITDCKFVGNEANIAVVYTSSNSTITGNYFANNTLTGANANKATIIAGPYRAGNFQININGNAFTDADRAVYVEDWSAQYSANNSYNLDGNYWYDAAINAGGKPNFGRSGDPVVVLDDYYTGITVDANNDFVLDTIVDINYVAQIGNHQYETFAEAYGAANAGDTILLLDDIYATSKVIITKAGITIDGNNKTIYAADNYTVDNKNNHLLNVNGTQNVTIKNVTFDGNKITTGVNVIRSNNIVLDNVTVKNHPTAMAAITVNRSTVTFKNKITTENCGLIGIDVGFEDSGYTLGIVAEDGTVFDLDASQTFKIADAALEDTDMFGAKDVNGDSFFYAVKYDSNGKIKQWIYTLTGTAYAGNFAYSLSNGDELQLLKDVTISKSFIAVAQEKEAILDLNGFTLSGANGAQISVEGTLKVKDGTTDGNVIVPVIDDVVDGTSSKVVYENVTRLNYTKPEGAKEYPDANGNTVVGYPVATVNGAFVYNADEAFASLGTDATVVLLENVELNAMIEVLAGENLTIDLNGHTITSDFCEKTVLIYNVGKLVINDTSTSKNGAINFNFVYTGYETATIDNAGELVINAGSVGGTSDIAITTSTPVYVHDVNAVGKTNFVASIGNWYYPTLNMAFANAKKGDVIELLANIEVTEQIKVVDNGVLSDITLNGNNHVITANLDQASKSVLYFGDTKTVWPTGVKINDLTIDATARFGIALMGGTSSVLTNVTIKGNYYNDIYGLHLQGTHGAILNNCYIEEMFTNAQDDNELVLNNTIVEKLYANKSDVEEDEGKIIINDGSKVNYFYFWGTSTKMIGYGYNNIENIAHVNGDKLVAKANDRYYTSIDDAFAYVGTAGGKITLLENVIANNAIVVESGKVVVLNLGGKTLNTDNAIVVNGDLTINGDGNVIFGDAYAINSNGTLTINGGNFTQTVGECLITVSGGNAVLNGGKFVADKCIVNGDGGTTEIKGGYYDANNVIILGENVAVSFVDAKNPTSFNKAIEQKYWADYFAVVLKNGRYVTITIKEYAAMAYEVLDEEVNDYLASGLYNEAGQHTFERMLADATAEFAKAITGPEVDSIEAYYLEEFKYVVIGRTQTTMALNAVNDVRLYAGLREVSVTEPTVKAIIDQIFDCANEDEIIVLVSNAYDEIDEIVKARNEELFAAQEKAIADLKAYDKAGVNVTSAMIASIYTAENLTEVATAYEVALTELKEIIKYKELIVQTAQTAVLNADALTHISKSVSDLANTLDADFNETLKQFKSAMDELIKIEETAEKINASVAKLDELKTQLENINANVDDVESAVLNELAKVKSALEIKIGENTTAITNVNNTLDALANDTTLADAIAGVKTDIANLNDITAQDVADALKGDFAQVATNIENLNTLLNSDTGLYGRIVEKVDAIVKGYTTPISESVARIEIAIQALDGKVATGFDNVNTTLTDLKTIVATIEGKVDIANGKLDDLAIDVSTSGDLYTTLKSEFTTLIDGYASETNRRLDDINTLITTIDTQNDSELARLIGLVQTDITTLSGNIDGMVTTIKTEFNNGLIDLNDKLNSDTGLYGNIVKKVDEIVKGYTTPISESVARIEIAIQALDGKVGTGFDNVNTTLTNLRTVVDEINGKVDSANGALGQLAIDVSTSGKLYTTLKAEFTDLIDGYASETNRRLDDINTLITTIDTQNDSELARLIGLVQTDITTLSGNIDGMVTTIKTEFNNGLIDLNDKLNSDTGLYGKIEEKLIELLDKYTKPITDAVQDVEGTIVLLKDTFTQDLSTINGTIDALKNEINTINGSVVDANVKLDGLATAVGTSGALYTGLIEQFKLIVGEYATQTKNAIVSFETLVDGIDSANDKAFEDAIKAINENIAKLSGKLTTVEGNVLAGVQGKLDDLNADLKSSTGLYGQIETQIIALTNAFIQKVEADTNDIVVSVENLQKNFDTNLSNINTTIANLTTVVNEIKTGVENANDALGQLAIDVSLGGDLYKNLHAEFERLVGDYVISTNAEIQALQGVITSIDAANDTALTNAIDGINTNIGTLSTNVTSLETTLNSTIENKIGEIAALLSTDGDLYKKIIEQFTTIVGGYATTTNEKVNQVYNIVAAIDVDATVSANLAEVRQTLDEVKATVNDIKTLDVNALKNIEERLATGGTLFTEIKDAVNDALTSHLTTVNSDLAAIKGILTQLELNDVNQSALLVSIDGKVDAIDGYVQQMNKDLAGDIDTAYKNIAGMLTTEGDLYKALVAELDKAIKNYTKDMTTAVDALTKAVEGHNGELTAAVKTLTDKLGERVAELESYLDKDLENLEKFLADGGYIFEQLVAEVKGIITDSITTSNNEVGKIGQLLTEMEGRINGKVEAEVKKALNAIEEFEASALTAKDVEKLLEANISDVKDSLEVIEGELTTDGELYKALVAQFNKAIKSYATETQTAITALNTAIHAHSGELSIAVKTLIDELRADTEDIMNEIDQDMEDLQSYLEKGGYIFESLISEVKKVVKAELAASDMGLEEITNQLNAMKGELNAGFTAEVKKALDAITALERGMLTESDVEELLNASISDIEGVLDEVNGKLATDSDLYNELVAEITDLIKNIDEVKDYATTSTAELQAWIQSYIEEILNPTHGTVKNARILRASAEEDFRANLEVSLAEAYSVENAQLILSYYDQAVATIKAATTKEQVDQAMITFKANVALVDALESIESGATVVTQTESDGVIIAVIIVVSVIGLVTICAIALVLVYLLKKKNGNDDEPKMIPVIIKQEEETSEEAEAPVATEAKEEVAAVAETADDEDNVSFSANNQQTLEEKYLELPAQAKGWYDEIAKKATIVENSKRVKNARYEEYKVGNSRIVRILIKRGVVFCEFKLQNSEFSNFVSKNKISVKHSATVIKVADDASCDVAKNTIDIVLQQIEQEKQYKKQLAREKRREKREQENN